MKTTDLLNYVRCCAFAVVASTAGLAVAAPPLMPAQKQPPKKSFFEKLFERDDHEEDRDDDDGDADVRKAEPVIVEVPVGSIAQELPPAPSESPSPAPPAQSGARKAGGTKYLPGAAPESIAIEPKNGDPGTPVTQISSTEKPERKKQPRRSGNADRSTAQQIESLKREVKDLKEDVARAHQKGEAKTTATTVEVDTPAPPHTTPLAIDPASSEARQPLVVDTPSDVVVEPPKLRVETPPRKIETERVVNPSAQPPVDTVARPLMGADAATPPPGSSPVAETSVPPVEIHTAPGELQTIPTDSDVPAAAKTGRPGIVRSPFPPHRLVEVSGLKTGSLAKDPTTQMIFRVP